MSVAAHFQSTPASVDLLRQGTGIILATEKLLVVPDARITASSIVVANLGLDNGVAITTQEASAVNLNPGTGFTVRIAVAATAGTGLVVSWAVLKY
jgi:hypothetical protein